MEKIGFEITDNDIIHYIRNNNDIVRFKEAMFVKYLKENKNTLTKESLEILLEKYNNDYSKVLYEPLMDFKTYLNGINNLDVSGICHILIPAIKYYDSRGISLFEVEPILKQATLKFGIYVSGDYPVSVILDTLDDYSRAFEGRVCHLITGYTYISLSKEWCKNELLSYGEIYGKDNVKTIKKVCKKMVR